MLGMHLARVQIDPDIKSKGMGNNKKMVLFASSEVRNMIIWGSYMIKNLLLPKTLNVGGGGIYDCIYDYHKQKQPTLTSTCSLHVRWSINMNNTHSFKLFVNESFIFRRIILLQKGLAFSDLEKVMSWE